VLAASLAAYVLTGVLALAPGAQGSNGIMAQIGVDLVIEAFDLADRYRQPVTVIADGMIGQIMEPVAFPELREPERPERPWALTGARGREKNIITSLFLGAQNLERENIKLQELLTQIRADQVRYAEFMMDDAEIVVVAYGTAGRIAQTAVKQAREAGVRVGLFRPISMFPFPYDRLDQISKTARQFLVVELSAGQMIEDVRLATHCRLPISFFGKMGGVVPLPEDILGELDRLL
jgi:2-oxoglutarate ferredoxin oxidoreductase subunit alpha